MGTRVEVSKRLRLDYRMGSKAQKSAVLDQFCAATGLSRPTARRYLTSTTIGVKNVVRMDRRRHKPTKYSKNAQRQLIRVWKMMGTACGKYMVAVMEQWIIALEAHSELVVGKNGWNLGVRDQLLQMSGATIDRYLKDERDRMSLKGISTTKPGALLRNSITVRKAGDEVEAEPGFFETDTVAHCGPTLKGEFARTLTLTDVHIGWVHLIGVRNNARVHILGALRAAATAIPYEITGLDCDNGSEFINHEVIQWAADKEIYFTRSRPYKKNDQATVESKNNHAVRRYGFHYRYDTPEELEILNHLWKVVCLKLNFFTATKKPIGWTQNASGKRKRIWDAPTTPYQRLRSSEVLSEPQLNELNELYQGLNPADLTRQILTYQSRLIALAKEKTMVLTTQVEQTQQARTVRLGNSFKPQAS